MQEIDKMGEFVMLSNKYTILFIAFIFQIGHVLYAGASTTIPVEVETVNKLFAVGPKNWTT